ncbi:MAG: 4Fe-4S binding protein [Planctomycetaceae bacterium]|nr:4Fe-4S binding protein [Planctomycetaceae bacterium]
MRLDWFLPVLRTPKAGRPARPVSRIGRLARRFLPAACFSDPQSKRRGLLRRSLRRVGSSWLASPVRRISQTLCFLTFVWLFLYVCWPYSAQPARNWSGFTSVRAEHEPDRLLIEWEFAPEQSPRPGAMLSLVSADGRGTPTERGRFEVDRIDGKEITLKPAEQISRVELDEIALTAASPALWEQPPGAWPVHYADNLSSKEILPADFFLVIDPLVSLSTAIASRSWVWSLACGGIILLVCVLIPRGFCGYICPLGSLIDLFDWSIGSRVKRFRVGPDGWWVHIKYYLLAGTLIAAAGGVLLTGFVAAIPVITRGLLFILGPLQTGAGTGWHQMPPLTFGQIFSIALFLLVLCLGFLRPRFWCKYVCPSGAVFSLGNLFRGSERKVESSCINCNKCVEVCPFDAIKPDFTTRVTDCTLCQTCAGVCPTHAIKFVDRWDLVELKVENDPPTNETALGRRGFLAAGVGTTAALTGGVGSAWLTSVWGANLDDPNAPRPVRPPGSVPEQEFLQMCIRCGECFKVCPSDVLQPQGFGPQGLEGLWTPQVTPDWAGCASSCNACGQVCPTGAIRALPMEEKKVARMGLAKVNESTCLPFAGREACQLCVDECNSAGYNAIEFTRVGTEVDEQGVPIEGTGYAAPVVLKDLCVGCGLCQTRCHGINVAEKGLLEESAIIIEAGEGREDRLLNGSYVALRKDEERQRAAEQEKQNVETPDSYLPDFLK